MAEQDAILCENELKILKALMFGKISAANFYARFESHAVRISLLSKKWIGFDGSWYFLTINGRAAIPKEQVGGIKPETISAITHATIKSDSKPLVIDQLLVTNEKEQNKSKTLKVLEFIEAHPNCSGGFIYEQIGVLSPSNFIKPYVDKGQVVVTGNTGRGARPQYRLADGLTVKDFYKKSIPTTPKITQKAEPAKPVIEEVKQDDSDINFEYENEKTVISYDSFKRLSIDGYELTPKQTSELLIFVHELGLVN